MYCALGWACWKTYVGRPETDGLRCLAIGQLGNGLAEAGHHEDALCVQEAELAMQRRLGGSEHNLLIAQGGLANTYQSLGRYEEALRLRRDVYSETLKLDGEENEGTFQAICNYASTLKEMNRIEEAKSLMRKTIPVARRVLGKSDPTAIKMRWIYALSLCDDNSATLDDLREAVNTFGEIELTARQVFGGAHPLTEAIKRALERSRAALSAHPHAAAAETIV